jgi:hypothetical protein
MKSDSSCDPHTAVSIPKPADRSDLVNSSSVIFKSSLWDEKTNDDKQFGLSIADRDEDGLPSHFAFRSPPKSPMHQLDTRYHTTDPSSDLDDAHLRASTLSDMWPEDSISQRTLYYDSNEVFGHGEYGYNAANMSIQACSRSRN